VPPTGFVAQSGQQQQQNGGGRNTPSYRPNSIQAAPNDHQMSYSDNQQRSRNPQKEVYNDHPYHISFVNTPALRVFSNIKLSFHNQFISDLKPEQNTMLLESKFHDYIWDAIGFTMDSWSQQIEKSKFEQPYIVPLMFVDPSHGIPYSADPSLTFTLNDISKLIQQNHSDLVAYRTGKEMPLNMQHIQVNLICEYSYIENSARDYEIQSKNGIALDLPASTMFTQSKVVTDTGECEINFKHEDPVMAYLVAVRTSDNRDANRWNTFSLHSEADVVSSPEVLASDNDPIALIELMDSNRNVIFSSRSKTNRILTTLWHNNGVSPTLNYIQPIAFANQFNDYTKWDGCSNLVRSQFLESQLASGNDINRSMALAPHSMVPQSLTTATSAAMVAMQQQQRNGELMSATSRHPGDASCTLTLRLVVNPALYKKNIDVFIVSKGRHIWNIKRNPETQVVSVICSV
jgi:hypothetical protein